MLRDAAETRQPPCDQHGNPKYREPVVAGLTNQPHALLRRPAAEVTCDCVRYFVSPKRDLLSDSVNAHPCTPPASTRRMPKSMFAGEPSARRWRRQRSK